MVLPAVALSRHEDGRHGHGWPANDAVRHGSYDAGGHAVAADGVRVRLRHVDGDDARDDDAVSGANVSRLRPYGQTNQGAAQPARRYCVVWRRLSSGVGRFCASASLVQWSVERAGLLDFTMVSTSSALGGALFVTAGLYQWTALNEKCLLECQRPFEFVIRHGGYQCNAPGCVMLGLRHGCYCVGCCWALMALLLVGGAMNVLWIALLALLAFLERVTSMGRLIARLGGIVFIAAGAWLFSMGM